MGVVWLPCVAPFTYSLVRLTGSSAGTSISLRVSLLSLVATASKTSYSMTGWDAPSHRVSQKMPQELLCMQTAEKTATPIFVCV